MAESVMLDRFDKSPTPSGLMIDRAALRAVLVGRLSPFEICELREHCHAGGEVTQLLQNLISYNVCSDLALSQLERKVDPPELERKLDH
jgi:hypothetical protein